jgi:chaperone required for assembly of F1-ATPase
VLPRRFYTSAAYGSDDAAPGTFAITLDGRAVRTPKKGRLSVPTAALAAAIAEEWAQQGEHIDPRTMPLTRLANTAIDGVRDREEQVRADLRGYAGNDLLCYRAEGPEPLVRRQAVAWDDVLAWARSALGARFVLAEGVMPVSQPQATIDAIGKELDKADAFQLAALHVITTLTGSVLLALAVLKGHLTVAEAWARAHVDEDWQIEQWGEDAEAAERRQKRRNEVEAAVKLLALINHP